MYIYHNCVHKVIQQTSKYFKKDHFYTEIYWKQLVLLDLVVKMQETLRNYVSHCVGPSQVIVRWDWWWLCGANMTKCENITALGIFFSLCCPCWNISHMVPSLFSNFVLPFLSRITVPICMSMCMSHSVSLSHPLLLYVSFCPPQRVQWSGGPVYLMQCAIATLPSRAGDGGSDLS